jgi:protein phosphatase 1 regulatory subunit 7
MSNPDGAAESSAPDPSENPDAPKDSISVHKHSNSSSSLRDSKGWDGKLRVEKRPVLVNPEVLDGHSDPEDSDEEDKKVDLIEADEGITF